MSESVKQSIPPEHQVLDLDHTNSAVITVALDMFGIQVGELNHLNIGKYIINCKLPNIIKHNISKFGLNQRFVEFFYTELKKYFKHKTYFSLNQLQISRNEYGPYFKVYPGDCACLGNSRGEGEYSSHNIDTFDQQDALVNVLRIFLNLAYKYYEEVILNESIILDQQYPGEIIFKLNNLSECSIGTMCSHNDTLGYDSPCNTCLRKISNQLSALFSPENLSDNYSKK